VWSVNPRALTCEHAISRRQNKRLADSCAQVQDAFTAKWGTLGEAARDKVRRRLGAQDPVIPVTRNSETSAWFEALVSVSEDSEQPGAGGAAGCAPPLTGAAACGAGGSGGGAGRGGGGGRGRGKRNTHNKGKNRGKQNQRYARAVTSVQMLLHDFDGEDAGGGDGGEGTAGAWGGGEDASAEPRFVRRNKWLKEGTGGDSVGVTASEGEVGKGAGVCVRADAGAGAGAGGGADEAISADVAREAGEQEGESGEDSDIDWEEMQKEMDTLRARLSSVATSAESRLAALRVSHE